MSAVKTTKTSVFVDPMTIGWYYYGKKIIEARGESKNKKTKNLEKEVRQLRAMRKGARIVRHTKKRAKKLHLVR